VWGARQWFSMAAETLAGKGYRVNIKKKWLTKGWLIWEKKERIIVEK
jgi:hypothetical protein